MKIADWLFECFDYFVKGIVTVFFTSFFINILILLYRCIYFLIYGIWLTTKNSDISRSTLHTGLLGVDAIAAWINALDIIFAIPLIGFCFVIFGTLILILMTPILFIWDKIR